MKNKLSIISIIAFSLLIGLVSAVVTETNNGYYGIINDDGSYTQTTTPITDYNAIGFICANDDCSSVSGTLWNGQVVNSGNDNQLLLTYPSTLQQKGYGVFIFKEGYFPFEVKADYYGNWAATANDYLTRKQNCKVPINDLVISHYGNKILVNVTLSSAVSSPVLNSGPLNYKPESIAHLYAVDSTVSFSFVGPENRTLVEDVNLPASEQKRVSVYAENLKAGQYQIIVESNTNDVKCINSIPLKVYSNLLIQDNRTNVTIPTIAILSPENNKLYTNKTILVNIRSTNSTNVFYNWNGHNVTYSGPVYVNFNEGSNTLTAYASNDVTTAIDSVTFNVNTTLNGLPSISIISPEHKAYNNKTLLVNIRAINANNVWFSWKGNIYNYTAARYFTFDEGFNNLTAFASNSQGTTSANVNFYINSSLICYNVMPIVRINSPLSSTYDSRNLLINITSFNATNVWYKLNNGQNINYNSPVYVNFNEGSNTLTAYAENPCGTVQTTVNPLVSLSDGGTSTHHNHGGKKVFPIEESENETIVPFIEEDNSPIVIEPKRNVKQTNVLPMMLVIFGIAVFILLILVLYVLLSR